MSDKATPTITLAELYENQNQYIDALVIYKNIYKENPTEELQNKIDDLKNIIFKENTLEYSTIIDKIFTEEDKRIFHILPHEQYKAYKESQAELKNDETYPEELIKVEKEESFEKIPKIEEETPDIEETKETEEEIEDEESNELEDTLNSDENMEDDISLEIDEEISDDLEKSNASSKQDTQTEDAVSIEDIVEKKKEVEQNESIDTEETDQSVNSETETGPIVKSHDKDQILNLLTKLSNIRPDIVERVLKENVGSDTSLADIKLSDLNYVVELLKVSANVERE